MRRSHAGRLNYRIGRTRPTGARVDELQQIVQFVARSRGRNVARAAHRGRSGNQGP